VSTNLGDIFADRRGNLFKIFSGIRSHDLAVRCEAALRIPAIVTTRFDGSCNSPARKVRSVLA
jgi:hypothetical protein